jgi:hypothetical protein
MLNVTDATPVHPLWHGPFSSRAFTVMIDPETGPWPTRLLFFMLIRFNDFERMLNDWVVSANTLVHPASKFAAGESMRERRPCCDWQRTACAKTAASVSARWRGNGSPS